MPASYTHTTSLNTLVIISNIYSNSLHTSFLRVIMHHGALLAGSTAGLPLVKKHNRTTDTTVALSCELPETTAGAKAGVATGGLIWFIIEMDQPQSFGDFGHGSQPTAVHQVNLPFSSYRSKGTPSLPRWRRGIVPHARNPHRLLANSPTGKSTPCAFPHLHRCNRKERRQAHSLLLQTTIEPLPHGQFGLVFQQAIDRQDRTQAEGRFSSTGTTLEISLQPGIQKYSTGQGLVARRDAL